MILFGQYFNLLPVEALGNMFSILSRILYGIIVPKWVHTVRLSFIISSSVMSEIVQRTDSLILLEIDITPKI